MGFCKKLSNWIFVVLILMDVVLEGPLKVLGTTSYSQA
jgi:hypothetical protein